MSSLALDPVAPPGRRRARLARPRPAGRRRGRRGPVCILAGAGTGKTRDHHPPDRLRGPERGGRRRRRCWRSPSPPGRPASCAGGCARWASGGCRRGRSTPPRCVSSPTSGPRSSVASRPGWSRASCGWWPRRRRGRCGSRCRPPSCATSRARSSGRSRPWSRPRRYAAEPRRARRQPPRPPETVAAIFEAYEAGQDRRRGSSTSRTCCC